MATKYVYDEAYKAKGWFDSILTPSGWFDNGFSEEDAPPTLIFGKVKVSGAFVDIVDRRIKLGGTFVSAVGYKVKIGGVFVDLI